MKKYIVGDNLQVDDSAVMENGQGVTVPASSVLCQFLPAAIMALTAAKSLVKGFIIKWAISIAIAVLEGLGEAYCGGK